MLIKLIHIIFSHLLDLELPGTIWTYPSTLKKNQL